RVNAARGVATNPTKKGAPWGAPSTSAAKGVLALRELERPTSLGPAVLLALDHAGVAGEEAAALERAAQLRLEIGQRLGDAVTDRAGLAGQAAAGDGADHVVLAVTAGGDERLLDQHAQHGAGEEYFDRLGVDHDLAGARLDPDARDRVLALAGRVSAALRVHFLFVCGCIGRGRLEARQTFHRL